MVILSDDCHVTCKINGRLYYKRHVHTLTIGPRNGGKGVKAMDCKATNQEESNWRRFNTGIKNKKKVYNIVFALFLLNPLSVFMI